MLISRIILYIAFLQKFANIQKCSYIRILKIKPCKYKKGIAYGNPLVCFQKRNICYWKAFSLSPSPVMVRRLM